MKRLLLWMGLMGLMASGQWSVASGQGGMVTLTKGEEGKNLDLESVLNGWYLGRQGDNDCWLTRSEDGPKEFADRENWHVVSLNRNLAAQGYVELLKTKDYHVLGVFMDGQMARMMLVDSNEKRMVVVVANVDLDSLTLTGNKLDTLARFDLAKDDRCYVWSAVSPGGEYVGILSLQQFTSKKQYVAEASMYDSELNELWSKEFPVGSVSCMTVSDAGEMVTMGNEHVGNEEHFTVNVITENTGNSYGAKLNCDRVQDLQIVNTMGRRVIFAGLFSSLGSKAESRMTGGTVTMAFDLDSATVASFTLRPFQNEDVNLLLNLKTKKVQKSSDVAMVMPLASVAMPYGAVLAVGRRYVLRHTDANGTYTRSYVGQGIHLVSVDRDGNVRWVRNLRRNDMEKHNSEMLYLSLFAQGDTVCLVKSEHPKYPVEYDIAKEAKELEMGEKNNLVLYRVAENGDVSKTVLEKKTKHSLLSSAKREDGSMLLMTCNGKKTRMVQMDL